MALKNSWWGSKQGQACPRVEEEGLGDTVSTGIRKPLIFMLLLCSQGGRSWDPSGKQPQGSGSFCQVPQLS